MKLHTLTDATFGEFAEQNNCLVFFYADWCPLCAAARETLEHLPKERKADWEAAKVKLAELNLEHNFRTADFYGINSVPTVAAFVNGIPVEGKRGLQTAEEYSELLRIFSADANNI
ncbi:MAG: thioredoxin family protein [Oscillospiraceae bacterium]|jgi:putative thioredoxin|nr:thioredoxin family protein [Oscillospiraceae bacterium]